MAGSDDEALDPKEKKKKDKEAKKEEKKKNKGGFDAYATDKGAMYTDVDDEDEGFSASVLLIVIFIVLIWVAILGLLIKLDIGGFGSGVLYPILKDVPVINKVLPEKSEEALSKEEFETLPDALKEIDRLTKEVEELKKKQSMVTEGESEEVKLLKEEITRLRTFEDSQIEFDKVKTEFYEEVVFSDNAPDPDNYKKYYESIDPDNAEYLYKQVVSQQQATGELDEYVKAYSDMKPKKAAGIFEEMTDNLDLVAKILGRMDATARGKILQAMDPDIASMITKIMDPD